MYTKEELETKKVSELLELLPEEVVKENGFRSTSKKTKVITEVLKNAEANGEFVFEEKPTTEKEETSSSQSKIEEFLKQTKLEAEKKKAKQRKDKIYIAKTNNYMLKSKGKDKNGKTMRYVDGLDTLDIGEQRKLAEDSELFIDFIKFKGSGNKEADVYIEGFGYGKSQVRIPAHDVLKQEFIENHALYGISFTEFDPKKLAKDKVEKRNKTGQIERLIASAKRDDLLVPLVYIQTQNGNDVWKRYFDLELYELQELAYDELDYNQETFIQAVESNIAKFIHLCHKLAHKDVLYVTSDGREVRWTKNNNNLIPLVGNMVWSEELAKFLYEPKNSNLLLQLQDVANYRII